MDTRVSTSGRVGSTPASQHQGAWARHPRLNLRARGSKAHVSVITALVMGPVTAHIAGRLAPHCGAFLGGTFTPGTSINSPVAMNHGGREKNKNNDNGPIKRETTDYTQADRERSKRELNSSASLLRTSCSWPTFSLRVLVDGAVLLLLPAEEKIPEGLDGHPVNGEQDHSPSPLEEPSLKQREDSRLNILPPL